MIGRFFVPGRLEVLGKHTDYAGGRSLLAAVSRGFTVSVAPHDAASVLVHDAGRDEEITIGLTPAGSTDAEPPWAVYPRTVVRRVAEDFPELVAGCRIELASDLPPAAGLSSSSAFVTAVFLALDAACGLSESDRYRGAIGDREALAGYLAAIERGSPFPALEASDGPSSDPDDPAPGVGTRGGSEDHVAILCARPRALVRYAFEPVRREGAVDMPAGPTFVVAASGVLAEKTGAARERYNRLSDEARRVVDLWRSVTGGDEPHLGAIVGEPGGGARLREIVSSTAPERERDRLLRRIEHFAAESGEIVPAAADALAAGDLEAFGELVARSQALAEELLENQVPETVHLARSARELGAVAASAFGAGFGGSVWAMVPKSDADAFLEDWRERYRRAFPGRIDEAAFFTTPAAPPARTL